MLEEKIELIRVSCVCHVHGLFFDLFNANKTLDLFRDVMGRVHML
jgi:hypothetical protein